MGLIKIHNRQNFVLGDIPAYHPASMKYLEFWREQKRRLIEGFWAPDDVGCNVDVQSFNPNVSKVVSTQWRWIPGNSYFYINFGTILHRPEGRPKTEPKIAMRPELRDVEWEIFYDIMEARGFSGFALDEEYSCNKDLIDPMLSESDYDDTCVGKEYVPARQYLRQLYTKPLGRPIFRNEAENYMLLSCRELGKSFCIGIGVILHELVTDGRKEYDLEQEVPISKQFVGSGMAGKSYDLMKKVRFAMQKLPGTWKPGTVDEVPSPFYKEMSGSIRPNNKWVHEYQKKIGGGWRTYGTRSDITHGVWTIENPEAAAGERYTFIICEECGLTSNLLTISGSNNAAQRQGTLQYGSSVYLGCVCAGTKVWKNNGELVNIEDLKLEDGIIGYDKILDKVVPQNIEILKSPETKECYRITLNSGRYLECSYDHPIYTRTRWDCGIMHKEFKYVKTVDLKVGDGIAVINNLDIFGNRRMFDPRLMGWLISDGTYGKGQNPMVMNSDPEILDYLESNYIIKDNSPPTLTSKNNVLRKVRVLGIVDKLRDIGIIGQTKLDKRLPNNIHSYCKEDICNFIGGLYDGDGCIYFGKDGYSTIKYTSICQELIIELQLLLNRLGITGFIQKEKKRVTKVANGKNPIYNLYIKDRNSLINFYNNIKLYVEYKQTKLDLIYRHVKNNRKSKYTDRYENIVVEKVLLVEPIGEKLVYNLSAGYTHTYFANGICTHNTGGNLQKIVESEVIFRDPEGFNMLAFEDEWENTGKIGRFFPALYKDNEFKDKNGNTDEERALEFYRKRREDKKKAKSRKALDMEMMNYPLVPSEMFLDVEGNKFPVMSLKMRLGELMADSKVLNASWKGHFSLDEEGNPKWKNGEVLPIREYPVSRSSTSNIEGCVEIFEHPVRSGDGKIPYGVYIAGCLTPGEKVLTGEGLRNVENITDQDFLVNSDGNRVSIRKSLVYNVENEETYRLRIANTYRTTNFTKEHPILVSSPVRGYVSYPKSKRLGISQRYYKMDFEFRKVEDVRIGDWVRIPNVYRKVSKENLDDRWRQDNVRIDRQVESPMYSEDFWWLMGIWLGDGYCGKYKVYVCFNAKERQYINKFVRVVKDAFNRDVYVKEKEGRVECSFGNKMLSKFLLDTFGKGAINKNIPEWVKEIPAHLKRSFLLGYLDSDGCIRRYIDVAGKDTYSTEFVSISLELLEGIQDILFSLGIVSNLRRLRKRRSANILGIDCIQQETYTLILGYHDTMKFVASYRSGDSLKVDRIDFNNLPIKRRRPQIQCFLDDSLNFIYFKIKEIEKKVYSGRVYNFKCESHTFICRHITTHNCDPVDDDDNRDITRSLQSLFIMNILTDRIVLEYTGRTKFVKDYYEQVRRALIYYNATLNYENQKKGLYAYLFNKNATYLLAETPRILADREMLRINTVGNKAFGVHATEKINSWAIDLQVAWLESQAYNKPEGVTNLQLVRSVGYLKEIISYNGKMNADREKSMGMLMILREDKEIFKENMKKKDTKVDRAHDPFFRNTFAKNVKGYRKDLKLVKKW